MNPLDFTKKSSTQSSTTPSWMSSLQANNLGSNISKKISDFTPPAPTPTPEITTPKKTTSSFSIPTWITPASATVTPPDNRSMISKATSLPSGGSFLNTISNKLTDIGIPSPAPVEPAPRVVRQQTWKDVADIPKEFAQSTAHSIGTLALTAGHTLAPKYIPAQLNPEESANPAVAKAIFGEEPIKAIGPEGAGSKLTGKLESKGLPPVVAGTLGYGGATIWEALNALNPFESGGKGLVDKLAKAKTEAEVVRHLTDAKVIEHFSPFEIKALASGDKKVAEDILANKKTTLESIVPKEQTQEPVAPIEKPKFTGTETPQEILAKSEAYAGQQHAPTQPEWVDVTHGGEKIEKIDLGKSNFGRTFFVTDKPEYAQFYANKYKEAGVLNNLKLKKDANLIDIKNATPKQIEEIRNEIEKIKSEHVPYSGEGGFNPIFGDGSSEALLDGAIKGKAHYAEDPALMDVYKRLGYDGMVTYEDVGGVSGGAKNIGIWNENVLKMPEKEIQKESHLKFDQQGKPLAYTAKEQSIVDRNKSALSQEKIPAPSEATTLPAQGESVQQPMPQTHAELSMTDKSKTPKLDLPEKIAYNNSIQKKILDARDAKDALDDFEHVNNPDQRGTRQQAEDIKKLADEIQLTENAPKFKDIGNIKKQFRDIYRNTEEVFGKYFSTVKKQVLDKFDAAKGAYVDTINKEVADFKKNIASKMKKGSKEDKAVQLFGEKKITKEDLIKQFGKEKTNTIMEAESWYKEKYDQFITEVNKIEKEIYPDNPEKWTPRRKDYFRHFHDLKSTYSRLMNILGHDIKIDPMIAGLSETTKPKSRWASFKQRRLGNESDLSAMGGFLDYLPNYSYAVNIDPQIGNFRELANALGKATKKSGDVNNYIYNLQQFANNLAGKTNELDRIVVDHIPGGRKTLQAVDWVNKRVKANTVLFNLRSSLSQILNVPQGIASAGPINSAKAAAKTLAQSFVKNPIMEKSNFLKERFFKGFDEFDTGILNSTKKFGNWMVSVLDEVGTKFIWNGQYEKAIAEGISDPIKFADDNTRKLVGGRGIGEKALIQNSKVFQVVAPFQLEVTNLWWAMQDLAKSDASVKKKFGQFAVLFLSMYALNDAMEQTTGSRPLLDPIQTTIDGIKILKSEPTAKGAYKAGGRALGEVLSNIPFGQTVASSQLFPEYGGGILNTPPRKELFGTADPTRFGEGLLATKALSDPLYKILPPYGGGQLEKSIKGIQAVNKGQSRTKPSKTHKKGDFQYKIAKTPWNYIKAATLGKGSLPEAQAYYEKKNTPKGKSKQSSTSYY